MKLKFYEYMHLKACVKNYADQSDELRQNDGSAEEWQEIADDFYKAVNCLIRRLDGRINEKIMDKIDD